MFQLPRSRKFTGLVIAIAASLCIVTRNAAADENDQRARALFDEAGELERRGNWVGAEDRLRAALRLRETPHLRYALAWALENQNKLIEARTEYEVALRQAQRPGAEEVSRLASARIAEVSKLTPLLQLRVRGRTAPSAHIVVDGREVPLVEGAGSLAVDPGKRVVRIEGPGRMPIERTVAVSPGMLKIVELDADDVTSSPIGSGATANGDAKSGSTVVPWILIGGGTALVGAGVYFFVASTRDVDARDESWDRWCELTACRDRTTATKPETAEATQLRHDALEAPDRANTKRILSDVLGGEGVVSIAAGTYWLLKKSDSKERTPEARFRFEAVPLQGGAFASATQSF